MSECFPGVRYHIDKTDWFAELPNRSQIWFGGLDDKERTEKILGQEYATVYLNECSQIPYSSRNMARTRLAQLCRYQIDGKDAVLPLRMYYDENPPNKAHWSYKLFIEKHDPDTKRRLLDADEYVCMQLNPEDNRDNLPESYLKELASLPARMRKRFLAGEFGDAAAGALWTDEMIDRWRMVDQTELPDMVRIVIAVDPSGADDEDNADNDEIGIVACGLGTDGNGYVLEDASMKGGPAEWGKAVTELFDRQAADLVVGEVNYGGAMVGFVIRSARPRTPYRAITASRGKVVRAEPISSLTEQGKIRFVGYFNRLEDELVSFTTHGYMGSGSPNRADAFVWAMSELFPALTKEKKEVKVKELHMPTGTGAWMV